MEYLKDYDTGKQVIDLIINLMILNTRLLDCGYGLSDYELENLNYIKTALPILIDRLIK